MVNSSGSGMERDLPSITLNPSGIGQYISYSSCPRFFRFKYFDKDIVNERNWYNRDVHGNLFSELGLAYEEEQLKTLSEGATQVVGDEETDGGPVDFDDTWPETVTLEDGSETENIEERWEHAIRDQLSGIIEEVSERDPDEMDGTVVLFQLPMFGSIGAWDINGIADLITIEPLSDSKGVRTRILEIKTSWKDKTSHQIQSTIYSLLLDDIVSDLELDHKPIATVVNRETELELDALEELPEIDLDSRTAEIKRLLKRDGELHRLARKSFEEVGYQLERKCDSCPYNGVCFTKAIESGDPALLNITQGNQERLEENGVESIADLTSLFEREEDTKPYDHDELPINEPDTVNKLESEGTLGNRLPELVQRAQVLRGEIDPSYEPFGDVQYLRGTGKGVLPDDSPHPNIPDVSGERGELIRVYLYVQHDPVRDRIALLAARVDGDQIEGTEIVEFSEELSTEQDESREEEAELLESFFGELFDVIQSSAMEVGSDPEKAYIHLYTYSGNERDAFMEAVQRQPTVFGSSAVRDLLGLRESIEQTMVSVVHSDITDRIALRYPGTGLLQTVEQLQAYPDDGYDRWSFTNEDWETNIGGEKIDLKSVFRNGLFEGYRPYLEQGDSVRLLLGDETDPEVGDEEHDGFYPLYNRFGNQIPLEYLWAARDKLDDVSEEDGDFEQYRFYSEEKEDEIGPEEVKSLARKFTQALEHVERSIEYKNWQMDKSEIEVNRLPVFSLRDTDLSLACQDYLDLEHATNKQECLEHYLDPPRKRMQSGDSTIFRVTNVSDPGGYNLRIEGELLYDELFREPERVIDSCRIKDGGDEGSGSWRVMSKLERDGDGFEGANIKYPRHIMNSVKATVEVFDRVTEDIVVEASKQGLYGNERYVDWHRDATLDPGKAASEDYTTLISPGDLFILDPYPDSYPRARAYEALKRTSSNHLYRILNDAFTDDNSSGFEKQFCSPEHIDGFVDEFESATGERPRGKQAEFVEQVDRSVAVLQGPPGTGKTSFTLAPSVLARMAAAEQEGRRLLTVVTAPSHTAVDEAMESIVDRWESYSRETGSLSNSSFIRVASGSRSARDFDPLVEKIVNFYSYHDSTDIRYLNGELRPHVSDDETTPDSHLILFTTPTSLRGLVDKCSKAGLFNQDGAGEVMDAGISFVDLLVIDEASMIDLPSTLLSSAFLKEDAQTLLIGDHRQMEPVQQHDWGEEDRRTIVENVPFMSVLNFVRFLRGDLPESEFTFVDSPQLGDAIPITRLDRTYRLHERVAELLTGLVYTDDGIELKSDKTETIEETNPVTEGVDTAMEPSVPVTLIVHGESESQDANRTEVRLAEAVLQALDKPTADEVGIVTPHNAQKGRLNERLGGEATIDTVERFQGGERDVMIISATASDPGYVRSEAEFLLNPNRLNVAMSRMKKKLVITASESVFEITPTDADEFDKTLIWKRLYDALGVTEDSPDSEAWTGTIGEFCPDGVQVPSGKEDEELSVYTIRQEN